MIDNIPLELRKLKQWVIASENKIPINPNTFKNASPTNRDTWGTFEQAIGAGYKHIGFMLSEQDPYTIIDLDYSTDKEITERQQAIIRAFNSYTEKSQSGKGYHIVIKGAIGKGVRRDKIEVYSKDRYMIFTGKTINNIGIQARQEILSNLTSQMMPISESILVDSKSHLSDLEVFEMATNAVNAEKFNSLCKGEIEEYPSQSEADFALLSMLCFYTRNNEQVRRLFRYSKLGKREKANRDNVYLDRCLRKIRAVQDPAIDTSAIQEAAKKLAEKVQEKQVVVSNKEEEFTFPPGLLGEVSNYIYQSSYRPVPQIALAGALTFFAGVLGRQYNVSSTGLNLYSILLGRTGVGKEGASQGINALYKALRQKCPGLDQFRGPATFASAPALAKSLVKKPCQFCVLGEFGIYLKDMCSPRVFGATLLLKRALLDVYHKSGWNNVLLGTEYSDREKNTGMVASPSLTILGETTPETFLEGLSESMIQDGFMPRFLFIEYNGKRPYLNKNAGFEPSPQLVDKLSALFMSVLQMTNNNRCINVDYTKEAKQIADDFELETTNLINTSDKAAIISIWNRAHLKALKVAALIAVGNNPHNPIISTTDITWSIKLVRKDTEVLLSRIERGEIGNGDSKLVSVVKGIIKEYYQKIPSKSYGISKELYEAGFIPFRYLFSRTRRKSVFNEQKIGSGGALKNAIQLLVDSGELIEIPKTQIKQEYKVRSKIYALGDM